MIRFQFLPTFKDFLAFNRLVGLRRSRFVLALAILILVFFLIGPFIQGAVQTLQTVPANRTHQDMAAVLQTYRDSWPALIFPAVLLLSPLLLSWAARRRWNAAKELRSEREYVIDDTGIQVRGEGFSGSLDWNIIRSADFKGGYFLLKAGQNTYHYFPASVVPDREAFVDLVRSKVKATKAFEASGAKGVAAAAASSPNGAD